MSREVKYSLKYFPPEKEVIRLFATQYPWVKQFVLLEPLTTEKKYENIVLGLGDLYMNDGNQVQIEYEIVAIPDNCGLEFEDIVAGRGNDFKELRNEIDFTLSGMLNAIMEEVTSEGLKNDVESKIILPYIG